MNEASTRIRSIPSGSIFPALLFCALSGCGGASRTSTPPEPVLVDFATRAPEAIFAMRYATADNFVGRVIDGYHARRCLLSVPAADALASVAAELQAEGLRLVLYDCYRPQRAVDDFVRWAADPSDLRNRDTYYPREPKATLFERGYIARQSGHSRASTVDLGLAGADGLALDMGTHWDFLDPDSATDAPGISTPARRNRDRLREVMHRHGFANYPAEWWHYTLQDEPYPDRYFNEEIR
jgi:D-alanyl-D-alanine dipeptidase